MTALKRKTMDRLTKEQRYKNMSANKGKGTKLELLYVNYCGMLVPDIARMIG